MKKLITLLFAISLIALFSCNSNGTKKDVKTDSTTVSVDTIKIVTTDITKK